MKTRIVLAALNFLVICFTSLPARAEHAPASPDEQKSERPLIEKDGYEKELARLRALSANCAEIQLKRFPNYDALLKAYTDAKLPRADIDKSFEKTFGIMSPYLVGLGVDEKNLEKSKGSFPGGLAPDFAALTKVRRSVFEVGLELPQEVLKTKGVIGEGTGFFINSKGHALTALHVVYDAILHSPNLSQEQKKTIEERGINPKDFPDGIELKLGTFVSGSTKSDPYRAKDLPENAIRVRLTAPISMDRAKLKDESTKGGLGDRDWALIEFPGFTDKSPWRPDFLPLDPVTATQKNIEHKQLFFAGYSGVASLFPYWGTPPPLTGHRNPRLNYCWTDDRLTDLPGITKLNLFDKKAMERLDDGRLHLVAGAVGSGDSGGPVFCNEGQRVCAIVTNVVTWGQSFTEEGRNSPRPPPMVVRVTPLGGFRARLREFPDLERAVLPER